ncbi:hypothetical protein [Acinetobacter lactucae]|uniref:hypothetical protein n=1 Tax=Acinetobacter lactucae TaxID=1785128 RepID=UPI00077E1DF0|nr:hypothetical protein [Acinetobacter lactucae]
MSNTTFLGSNPIWANACVGDNGYINYLTYAKGYSKAANLILDYLLQNNGNDVDLFIYPVCFNMRHSIELRIKGAIQEIDQLAEIKELQLPLFNLAGSHDIGNIWNYFRQNSEVLDFRFKDLNDLLDQTIRDIAEIDSTGQTFRYPFDTENKKHLTEQRTISCVVLKNKFKELEKNLDSLKHLNELLIEEYKLGTFTSKFSRAQIFNFAHTLPPIERWKSDLDKESLRSQYSLTSNDLTKIINLVKSNYEICSIVKIKKNLIALSDEFILELCSIWANSIYPKFRELYTVGLPASSYNLGDRKNFEKIREDVINKKKVYEVLEPKLNIDLVADLWSLFYFSRENMKYSEDYISNFEYFQKDVESERSLIDAFNHIFSKPNFLENIIKSLFFLQQIELAEKIIENNQLELYFNFIPDIRSRVAFKKWELLGYNS